MAFSNASISNLDAVSQWSPIKHACSSLSNKSEGNEEPGLCYLNAVEIWWRNQYEWLKESGYILRSRYRPGWVPSWKSFGRPREECEDSIGIPEGSCLMDATQISDGVHVILKIVDEKRHPNEADVALFLTSDSLALDPRNHCAPIFEVLEVPYEPLAIIVMPLLQSCYPDIKTVGEATELIRQMIDGLDFMHDNCVAHLNPNVWDIMHDPSNMHPNPRTTSKIDLDCRRAGHFSRINRPPKYFISDFRLSKRYTNNPALDAVVRWKNNFAPEYKRPEVPCDPFALDVYLLGDTIRSHFLMRNRGLEWIKPLLNEMCTEDPNMRPTMAEVAVRYGWLISSLSDRKLGARLGIRGENGVVRFLTDCRHRIRRRGSVAALPPDFFGLRVHMV